MSAEPRVTSGQHDCADLAQDGQFIVALNFAEVSG
jgi:hypothetical protein